ncbi:MAG: maleylpyruvate isomerase family mycothiol-dependent enzyme [Acidimicrobiales bacterium]
MDHLTHCDLLAAELPEMERAFRAADPAAAVPACPDWTVADLATHLGRIHRWVAAIVGTASPVRIDARTLQLDLPSAGATADTWADWLADGGQQVLSALRDADTEAEIWTWGGDNRVPWWSRRQLHETLVHRIDAEQAAGAEWTVDPTVAVDAIDEHLGNIAASAYFSSGVQHLKGEGSLHLHATDVPGEWMIELTPDGFTISHDHGKGTVAARGTAKDLLAAVTNRGTIEPLEVFGDAELLTWWLKNSALE